MTNTEWGYECPWGFYATSDRKVAEGVVANMQSAGLDARVVWRAVSDWQEVEDE